MWNLVKSLADTFRLATFMKTEEERYLEGSRDIVELEQRMKEIQRRMGTRRGI